MILFSLWKTKSRPEIFFFIWFAFSIAFVFNIFPLDMTYAERWFYFPMIGFLGILVSLLNWVAEKRKWLGKIILPAFLIIILLLSFRTIIREGDWRNGLTLFSHDVVYSQNSFDLENNLGVELFRAGKISEAKTHFEKSISLQPGWWFPYNNLGAAYEREGDLKKARELYEKSIEKGNYFLAHENLAFIVLREEKPEEAIRIINQSLAVLPYNLRLWTALTLAYYKDEQFEKAEELARKLYASSPNSQTGGLLEAILNRKEINF
jgi:tetratricopeptide (TPR) repeat protein